MAKVTFDIEKCKGCGLCVGACPKKIVILDRERINKKGYHPAGICDPGKCTACTACAMMCPDCIITIDV